METEPELISRPFLDPTSASQLLEKLYGLNAAEIQELESFSDQNFHVILDTPLTVGNGATRRQWDQFIFKVYNSKDSVDGNRIELAVNTMAYLWNKGFCCPLPVTNLDGNLLHLEKVFQEETRTGSGGRYGLFMTVLLTFIPGQLLSSLDPVPSKVFVDAGRHLANIHKLLEGALRSSSKGDSCLPRLVKDFEDYERDRPSTYCSGEWSLDKLTDQRPLLGLVEDADLRKSVEKAIDLFGEHVVPVLSHFRQGLIHGDFNDNNIIVTQRPQDISQHSPPKVCDQYAVSGVIDFGDAAYTYIVCDIAIAVAEVMIMKSDDSLVSAAQFLSGYLSVQEIPDMERKAMFHLVLARYAQHIVLSLEAWGQDPTNDYIMEPFADCCAQLKKLLSMQKCNIESVWKI